ncbi:uncharacterized protein LOC144019610 [Festucalex cinctus]
MMTIPIHGPAASGWIHPAVCCEMLRIEQVVLPGCFWNSVIKLIRALLTFKNNEGLTEVRNKTPMNTAMASSLSFLLLVLCALPVAQAQLKVFNLRASGLPSDILGITDGYVNVFCGSATLGTTTVREDTVNPWWEEKFSYFKAQESDVLRLEVHDRDLLFDDLLGVCQRQIRPGTHEHDCYLEEGGTLHYAYTFGQNNQ